MADPLIAELCGYPFPASLMQLLASILMKNAAGEIWFNYTIVTTDACDCEPVIDCDNNHIPLENLLVLGFGLDACGHLAIKLGNCDGTDTRAQ
jgi:hypothetical protein